MKTIIKGIITIKESKEIKDPITTHITIRGKRMPSNHVGI